jgi:plasmid stability protein
MESNKKEVIDALFSVSELESNFDFDERDSVVREIIKRSGELGQGAECLSRIYNSCSIAVLSRSILENLIVLLWVILNEENAIEHARSYEDELKKILRINIKNGNASIFNKVSGEKNNSALVFGMSPKRKNISEQARLADVGIIYDIFYRFLCLDTHGKTTVSKTIELKKQETEDYMSCVGALAMAIGHVGAMWLLHRQGTSNEMLIQLLGLSEIKHP